MLIAYLALVVTFGAISAGKPSCTPALVVWYGLLIEGGSIELWWPLAGLVAHLILAAPLIVFMKALN
jgi:hypothetical protein